MSKKSRAMHEKLSDDQSKELIELLNDGFIFWGKHNINLHNIIEELFGDVAKDEFYDIVFSKGREKNLIGEFFVEVAKEDQPFEYDIRRLLEYYEDVSLNAELPSWGKTNPFNFPLTRISDFFNKRLVEYFHFDEIELKYRVKSGCLWDYVQEEEFYSKIWFEVAVTMELEKLRELETSIELEKPRHPLMLTLCMGSAGRVGRMLEHYRWRFSHGHHAVIGGKSDAGARDAGRQRAANYRDRNDRIIAKMTELLTEDPNVSKAAKCCEADRTLSVTKDNARRIWYRHSQKL